MGEVKVILLIYVAIVTSIGVYSFFRVRSASDYYVNSKRGNWWQVSGSLFATIMGGSAILGTIELSQKAGWAAVWFLLSTAAGLFVLSFMSQKISTLGHYTLPELLLRFYGRKAEKVAGLMIPVAWLGIVAAQIIAGAKIISSLGLFQYQDAALLCGLVFIFYTIAGGQLSILKTDFIQALIILSGITVLVVLRLKDYPLQSVRFNAEAGLFNEHFTPSDLFFLLITYSITFVVGPDIYSRIFCARSVKVARNSVLLVATLMVPVAIALTFLGVSAAQGTEQGTINQGFILPGTAYLPGWALGLLAAALLSAVMSSADTTLLTSSMIVTELVTGDLDKKWSFPVTRVSVVILGTASLLIALHVTSILKALLLSLSFFSGAFIIPVIFGLLNKSHGRALVFYAIIAGGFMSLTGKIVAEYWSPVTGNIVILTGFATNLILMLFKSEK